jgi:hypothetical protein
LARAATGSLRDAGEFTICADATYRNVLVEIK